MVYKFHPSPAPCCVKSIIIACTGVSYITIPRLNIRSLLCSSSTVKQSFLPPPPDRYLFICVSVRSYCVFITVRHQREGYSLCSNFLLAKFISRICLFSRGFNVKAFHRLRFILFLMVCEINTVT